MLGMVVAVVVVVGVVAVEVVEVVGMLASHISICYSMQGSCYDNTNINKYSAWEDVIRIEYCNKYLLDNNTKRTKTLVQSSGKI